MSTGFIARVHVCMCTVRYPTTESHRKPNLWPQYFYIFSYYFLSFVFYTDTAKNEGGSGIVTTTNASVSKSGDRESALDCTRHGHHKSSGHVV